MSSTDQPSSQIGVLETPRLRLRPLTADDVDLLVELDSDGEVMRYISGRPSTREEVEAGLPHAIGNRWLAFERDTGDFVGWLGAIPCEGGRAHEVGWRLRRSAWGRGLATEGARAVIDALFASGATRVFAQTMALNRRSRRVMERCGLQHCRTFHLSFDDPLPGTELGEVEYELSRDDWRRQSAEASAGR